MSAARSWVLPAFLLIVFGGAIVLGPLIYALMSVTPWPQPFHRAMDRAVLVSAVAALAVAGPSLRLRELWPFDRAAWQQYLLGLFIALVSAQLMLGAELALGGFESAHLPAGKIAARVALALTAALLVPPLEETIFRGFLLRELAQFLGQRAAWLLAALIYAAAHFIKIAPGSAGEAVYPWSGVTALGGAFLAVGQAPAAFGQGINLTLIGLILGATFLRSGALWFNAGLHGGWVFVLLMASGLTRTLETPYQLPGFGADVLANPATTVVLLLLSVWLWRFYHPHGLPPETGSDVPST